VVGVEWSGSGEWCKRVKRAVWPPHGAAMSEAATAEKRWCAQGARV
jgi:hypothetical protein